MSKQQQAPGELELVREFVNTLDLDPGIEQLGSPDDLSRWLVGHGLASAGLVARPVDLRQALKLREALRAILVSHNGGNAPIPEAGQVLDDVACRANLRLRFDVAGDAALLPKTGGVDGALGRLLAIVHSAIADGTWRRLKACRLDTCEWAFYDHTKNHSGAWCNMDVCGNRAKARTYRARHAGATA